MASNSYSQIRTLQDKTSLKGVYLFLAFSIIFTFYHCYLAQDDISIMNPYESLGIYLIILSISSVFAAVFYYLKIEIFLFKLILMIYANIRSYKENEDIKLSQSIDHFYISEKKKNFFSKILFTAGLFILSFAFIMTVFYIIILILILIVIAAISVWIFYDSRDLMKAVKLIYLMKLFIRDNSSINNKVITKFKENIENNLWFEAIQAFSQFIKEEIQNLCEPYLRKLEYNKILRIFTNVCFDIGGGEVKFTHNNQYMMYFLDKLNEYYNYSKDQLLQINFIKILKDCFNYYENLILKINTFDKWINYFIFYPEIFKLDDSEIKKLNKLIDTPSVNKINSILSTKEYSDQKIEEELSIAYFDLLKRFFSRENLRILTYVNDFIFNEANFVKLIDKIRNFINFLEKELKIFNKMKKGDYQKVFDAYKTILKFCFVNYKKNIIEYKGSIINELELLKKFEYDLDKLKIYCIFFSENRIFMQILPFQIEITLDRIVQNIFKKYVSNIRLIIKKSLDEYKQKEIIVKHLKDIAKEFKLKFD